MVSLFFLVFLYIWATILVIRMVALAARMVSRYHPNHPSLSPRPAFDVFGALVELSNMFFSNGNQKSQKLVLYVIPGTLAEENIKI